MPCRTTSPSSPFPRPGRCGWSAASSTRGPTSSSIGMPLALAWARSADGFSATRLQKARPAMSDPTAAPLELSLRRTAARRPGPRDRAGRALAAHADAVRARPHQPVGGRRRHLDGASGGWALLDTGLQTIETADCLAHAARALRGPLGGAPVTRVFVTHMHPDHIGMAGWMTRKLRLPPVDDPARVPELPRPRRRHRARGARRRRPLLPPRRLERRRHREPTARASAASAR